MTEHLALDTQPNPYKLRIEDYDLLDQAGAFAGEPKTELIDGVLYQVSPQHRLHGFAKDELAYRLRRALEALGSTLHVATEQSVAMGPYSKPQPDIILTSQPRGPGAIPVESVALIAEIAVSSTDFDLNEKLRIYAAAGIREYWVVDVNEKVVRQHWNPNGESYGEGAELPFGSALRSISIDGLTVETGGLV